MKLSFHFNPVPEDSFVVTPALVITQGRCPCCDELAPGYMLSMDWLMWSVGVMIEWGGKSH